MEEGIHCGWDLEEGEEEVKRVPAPPTHVHNQAACWEGQEELEVKVDDGELRMLDPTPARTQACLLTLPQTPSRLRQTKRQSAEEGCFMKKKKV